MAEALIRGLRDSGECGSEDLWVSEPRAERRTELAAAYGIECGDDNPAAAAFGAVCILAVKPQILPGVLEELGALDGAAVCFLSIAAGVTTSAIERGLGGRARVVRAMPNTPALVGKGVAAVAAGRFAAPGDMALAHRILGAVGTSIEVDEEWMDIVTAVSGSGPAYVFYLMEAMMRAGERGGLPREIAAQLVVRTVTGAAELAGRSGEPPWVLRERVTSKGGTTEAALRTLDEAGCMSLLERAVEAARDRSLSLSH
jgi:pyrroline-5-carboxylate reductase